MITDFTNSVDDIESRLLTVKPGHRTALLDAIYFGLNKMKQAKNERKALLVVSDGGDNRSRYTESEVRSVVRESDVQIYSIGIFDQYAPTREEQLGPILLHDVSEEDRWAVVPGGRSGGYGPTLPPKSVPSCATNTSSATNPTISNGTGSGVN